jgi:probable rRNA maturation factor
MPLQINISADSKFPVDRKLLRTTLFNEWDKRAIGVDANLSIAIVGTRKMAELHKKFMKREGATDVLTFPQQSTENGDQGFVTPDETPLELGDIVICYPLALDQAIRLGVLVDERIQELAVHGFGNLMGDK